MGQQQYLCVNAEYVALNFIHGVQAVGYSAQVEPFENHLILGEGSWNKTVTGLLGQQVGALFLVKVRGGCPEKVLVKMFPFIISWP